MVTALVILAFMARGFLLAIGLWGKQIDDHPLCSKCGFDLFGKPEESRVCPECGTGVTDVRGHAINTVHGHRKKNIGRICAGLLLLIFSGGWLGMLALADVSGRGMLSYEPMWMIGRQLDSANFQTQDEAVHEILFRLKAGDLLADQIHHLIDHGLRLQLQTNPQNSFHFSGKYSPLGQWIEFMNAVIANGQIQPAQLQKYATQSVQFFAKVRPEVRKGDPLPFEVGYDAMQVNGFVPVYAFSIRIDNTDVPLSVVQYYGQSMPLPLAHGLLAQPVHWRVEGDDPAMAGLEIGRHVARIQITGNIYRMNPTGVYTGPPITTLQTGISTPFDVVADDQAPVKFFHAQDHWPLQHIKTPDVMERSGPSGGSVPNILITLEVFNAPYNLGYDICIRANGKEWIIGRATFKPFKGDFSQPFYEKDVPDFDSDVVDVILRPSLQAARESEDVNEISDEEVDFPNVQVNRMGWTPPNAKKSPNPSTNP